MSSISPQCRHQTYRSTVLHTTLEKIIFWSASDVLNTKRTFIEGRKWRRKIDVYEIAYKLIPLCATDSLIYVKFIADRQGRTTNFNGPWQTLFGGLLPTIRQVFLYIFL